MPRLVLQSRFTAFVMVATIRAATIALFAGASGVSADGNWRLVNFWSEWCSPCRKEIPMLNTLNRDLASRNVQIVGVNFDDDPRPVTLEIARKLGIEFYTLTDKERRALKLKAPDAMPTTYIVSPDEQVVAKLVGLQSRSQLLAQLERLGLSAGDP